MPCRGRWQGDGGWQWLLGQRTLNSAPQLLYFACFLTPLQVPRFLWTPKAPPVLTLVQGHQELGFSSPSPDSACWNDSCAMLGQTGSSGTQAHQALCHPPLWHWGTRRAGEGAGSSASTLLAFLKTTSATPGRSPLFQKSHLK